jgi:hypothetical protein
LDEIPPCEVSSSFLFDAFKGGSFFAQAPLHRARVHEKSAGYFISAAIAGTQEGGNGLANSKRQGRSSIGQLTIQVTRCRVVEFLDVFADWQAEGALCDGESAVVSSKVDGGVEVSAVRGLVPHYWVRQPHAPEITSALREQHHDTQRETDTMLRGLGPPEVMAWEQSELQPGFARAFPRSDVKGEGSVVYLEVLGDARHRLTHRG